MIKAGVWALGMLLAASAVAGTDPEKLRTFGANDSILIYVFTSPACPHCAAYHADILPVLKQRFADKGLAQIKMVDTPGDVRSLAVSRLARCLTDEQYAGFMHEVYQNQSDWWDDAAYADRFQEYALAAGAVEADLKRCQQNSRLEKTITDQRDNLARLYRVSALPTTVVVRGLKHKSFLGADERILSDIEEVIQK